ncbi:MAG: prepilin-type N-terminal cleavage/methylation domain-containing protein [Fibrobacter sp.]|nr:prepilin-type N-terminal cleavage/methylation domain-containing protein [Fibrobacter sp.]
MINRIKDVSGATLIELMVAMFIGSLVVMGAYQAYNYVTKSTARENEKALIQKDIVTITERLGKDIRMAGNGLPGNGIRVALYTDKSDTLELFYNLELTGANPVADILYDDVKLFAANCLGAKAGGYICITGQSIDTIYKQISRVGNNASGEDTIYLSSKVGAGTFPKGVTKLHYCDRIAYEIQTADGEGTLVLSKNAIGVPLGSKIDTMNITPKNKAGTALTSGFENTSLIEVLVGGYIGKGANRNMLSETIQVGIRNQ